MNCWIKDEKPFMDKQGGEIMVYDYIVTKPELNEDTLTHYGIKGMKWKKRLKGKYYRAKSKIGEKRAGINRWMAGFGTMDISDNHGRKFRRSGTTRTIDAIGKTPGEIKSMIYNKNKKFSGTANSMTGGEGSRVDAGIAAGRERAKKKKKEKRR